MWFSDESNQTFSMSWAEALLSEVQDGSDKLISIWVEPVCAQAVVLFPAGSCS